MDARFKFLSSHVGIESTTNVFTNDMTDIQFPTRTKIIIQVKQNQIRLQLPLIETKN